MSDPHGYPLPPTYEPPPTEDQAHEYVVEHVEDVTLGGPIVFGGAGGEMAYVRSQFPVTYDIPDEHPEAVHPAEDL